MAKKFKFSLQSVLNLKEFREELLKQDLGRLIEKLNEENSKLDFLQGDIVLTKSKLGKELSGDIKTAKVIECNQYLRYLHYLVLNQEKIIESIERAILEKRQQILKNKVEKKVVEKMKDKQLHQYTKEINLKSQKNIDDLTMQRFFFEKEKEAIRSEVYAN